jgi:hypothetical protein
LTPLPSYNFIVYGPFISLPVALQYHCYRLAQKRQRFAKKRPSNISCKRQQATAGVVFAALGGFFMDEAAIPCHPVN